jgi:hypothetical protein
MLKKLQFFQETVRTNDSPTRWVNLSLESLTGSKAVRWGLSALCLLTSSVAPAEAGSNCLAPVEHQISEGTLSWAAGKPWIPMPMGVLAAPVAYARTSQIMLNTYGNTLLAVPLSATDLDAGGSIVSYNITMLTPSAAGVLRLNGTTVTTATVIAAVDAANLMFDPAVGYLGTAIFLILTRQFAYSNQ